MTTVARPMTVEQFERYAAGRPGRCELVRGEVRALSPTGFSHGHYTGLLHYHLTAHALQHNLGAVLAAETGFRLGDADGPSVRAPDIAFVARDRLPAPGATGFVTVAPDLVVETLSPSDSASDVAEKTAWWLRHGVRLVWILDPQNQTVTAHLPDGAARVYDAASTLDAGDALPGFALPLAQLFPPA